MNRQTTTTAPAAPMTAAEHLAAAALRLKLRSEAPATTTTTTTITAAPLTGRSEALTAAALRRRARLAAAAGTSAATSEALTAAEAGEALAVLRQLARTATQRSARNIPTLSAEDVASEAAARLLTSDRGRDALRVVGAPAHQRGAAVPIGQRTSEAEAEALRIIRGAVRSVVGTALRSMTTEAAAEALAPATTAERIAARRSTSETQRDAVAAALAADGPTQRSDSDHQRSYAIGAAAAGGWRTGRAGALRGGASRGASEAAARLSERRAVRSEARAVRPIREAGNYRSNAEAAQNASGGAVRQLRETSLETMLTEALRWHHATDASTTEAEKMARRGWRDALASRLAGDSLTGRAGSAAARLAEAVRLTEREAPAARLASLETAAALATRGAEAAAQRCEALRLVAVAVADSDADSDRKTAATAAARGARTDVAAAEALRLRYLAALRLWRAVTSGGARHWSLAAAVTSATYATGDSRHGAATAEAGAVDWEAVLATMRPALTEAEVHDPKGAVAAALRLAVRRAAAAVAGLIGWQPTTAEALRLWQSVAPLAPLAPFSVVLSSVTDASNRGLGKAEALRWRRLAVLSTIDRVAEAAPLVIDHGGAQRGAAADYRSRAPRRPVGPWSPAPRCGCGCGGSGVGHYGGAASAVAAATEAGRLALAERLAWFDGASVAERLAERGRW